MRLKIFNKFLFLYSSLYYRALKYYIASIIGCYIPLYFGCHRERKRKGGGGGMYDAQISFNFTSNSCQVALVLTIPLSNLY